MQLKFEIMRQASACCLCCKILFFFSNWINLLVNKTSLPRYRCTLWLYRLKWNMGLFVFPSCKIIVKNLCRIQKPCSAVWSFGWEWKLSQDHRYVSRWLSISCPPPTLPWWYEGRAIYTESWGTIPQYIVLLSRSSVMPCFSRHHQQQWWHLPSTSSPEED
jgi:hypothetical protein